MEKKRKLANFIIIYYYCYYCKKDNLTIDISAIKSIKNTIQWPLLINWLHWIEDTVFYFLMRTRRNIEFVFANESYLPLGPGGHITFLYVFINIIKR